MKDNCNAYDRFKNIPKLNIVNLYTPVERCDRLRKKIPGSPNIFIKRDDFIGYIIGGNKIRKLEYVMADVMRREATTVMTIGSIQSNHARITAMVARRYGLKCVLILNGETPNLPRSNFYINKLLGVDIHIVKSRAERNKRMDEIGDKLEKKGERVYKIPLGASDDVGSFGFVAAFEEIFTQQEKFGINFDTIIIGSSSGGTQAGLEVGKRLFNQSNIRIMGISPDDPAECIKDSLIEIAKPIFSRLGLNYQMNRSELLVDDQYVGEGYGIPTKKSEEAIKIFSNVEGILLDPVYTSKTAAAVIDYCRSGMFKPDENVLFWHTGGLITLFK